MATQYTSILKLALPVQGELSGTWGDVVNDNITSMVEEAIAGRAVINTWTTNSHILTTADGTTSESRAAILTLTDTGTALTGAGTVVCPAASKIYIVENGTGQTITVKTSAGTGVAVPDGKNMVVFCDGTNVEESITNINSLTLNGDGATVSSIKDEDNMASDSATALATQQSIKAYVDSQVGANNELSEVLANGNTTGGTDLSVSSGDDITFADSSKAIFGAGSDLQIYHDGSHSYVQDTNAGNLYLKSNGAEITLRDGSNTSMIRAFTGGGVRLFNNGTERLEVTSTGIDVTGQVVSNSLDIDLGTTGTIAHFEGDASDSLNIDGDSNAITLDARNVGHLGFEMQGTEVMRLDTTGIDVTGSISADGLTVDGYIALTDSGSSNRNVLYLDGSDNVVLSTATTAGFRGIDLYTQNSKSLSVAEGGDISFYDTSGSSQNLFWDASTSRLGLGTTSPSNLITVENSNNVNYTGSFASANALLRVHDNSNYLTYANPASYMYFSAGSSGVAEAFIGAYRESANKGALIIGTQDGATRAERMRIASDGSCRWTPDGTTHDMTLTASGNLLVGTTDGTPYASNVSGAAFYSSGAISGSVDGLPALYLNRKTSDGTIADFRKDGSTVGSIGVVTSDNLFIQGNSSHVGLAFGSSALTPFKNGAYTDNVSDIGGSSNRFKDLYLSNAVKFGSQDALATDGTSNYVKSGSAIYFQPANTTRMLLDASGNLLVGTTDTAPFDNSANSSADNGIALRSDGILAVAAYKSTANSGNVVTANRTGTDGPIIGLQKSGTTVGSIGTEGGDLTVGTGNAALRFNDGAPAIYTVNASTAAVVDASIDLGAPTARFKDLYLSGGAYLGGVAAANKLDDYEEGTWTPTYGGTTTIGTGTYSFQNGSYTKVGNVVTVNGYFRSTAHTGTGNIQLRDLPFTVASGNNNYAVLTIGESFNLTKSTDTVITGYAVPNTDTVQLRQMDTDTAATSTSNVVMDVGFDLLFTLVYRTA